jgi:single-strand DNA-binding protein
MGRLTADPELKHIQNGTPVVSFSLAVDRPYVKSGTERVTDFINIVAWRKTAEFVSKYFNKGQLVVVEGSLQTRSYQDKEGINRKTFEIIAEKVHFAEPKRNNAYDRQNDYDQSSKQEDASKPAFSQGNAEDFQEIPADDDLPF